MKVARIHEFGGPDVIVVEDAPRPAPGNAEVLIRTGAAGVGNWDALIRTHKSGVSSPLPIILGSELAGTVEEVGTGVSGIKVGDPVYGATNSQFIGAYAELAIASAGMITRKPNGMSDVEAASVPIVAVTAWQMLFDYARAKSGEKVLIHGGAGNVGAYAVQLASQAGLQTIATAASKDAAYVRSLGAERVIDFQLEDFEREVSGVDVVIDTVGGATRDRSMKALKPGGILVSVVSPIPKDSIPPDIRAVFFLVEVTTARLNLLTERFENGKLKTHVGSVLPFEKVREAHQMLAGAPHKPGKIVLTLNAAR